MACLFCYQNLVRISKIVVLCAWLCVLLPAAINAMVFEMTDGTTVDGEVVLGKPESVKIRLPDSTYKDITWDKFSQQTIKKLAEDQKLKSFVEPYIEIPEEERIRKTEVQIKPVPRLDRPAKGSLLGSLFKSSVGLVMLLLLYGANIYAGYEIATVRAYPPAMVCGVAAVAPVIGPVVFLCLPTRLESTRAPEEEDAAAPRETPPAYNPMAGDPAKFSNTGPATRTSHAGHAGEPAHAPASTAPAAGGLSIAHGHAASTPAEAPKTEVFKRGQFTFNRRFIETKFSGFFGAVRRDASKDMVLFIKTVRGDYTAVRITRIAANDMHIESRKGEATQEINIPLAEIQEIHLKHKDA